jgi:CubicO group peptidase (beta-lactamase class C family)
MCKLVFGRLWALLVVSLSALGPVAHAGPEGLRAPDIRAWADKEVGGAVSSGHASAALVSVVANGRLVFAQSYGVFDPATGSPVDTLHDQVIIASITKTFTSTAIVQLVEAGKIRSLDDPANLYLKRFKLPNFHGKPVTLRELATHSSGLDSPGWGTSIQDQTAIPAAGDYILRKLPKLVRTPGRYAVYANFGPPILGAVIEDVTGERFDAYVERHLLKPLGMNDSLINYDPTGGPRLIHAGLVGASKPARALRMINVPYAAPAGSLQTTAPDMAHYMLAQLGHAPEVISPGMISVLQSPQHINYPGLPPIGFSFFLFDWNGAPLVTHGGNIQGL